MKMVMAFSNIFFDDATSSIIGKTECLKTSLCPSQLSAFMGCSRNDPSFFNSIALLIVSSTPHPQLASILKIASVCFLSSVTMAMSSLGT
jgi:hypothetical protein